MSDAARERVKAHWEEQHVDNDPDSFLDHPFVQAYISLRSVGDLTPHLRLALASLERCTRPGSRILSVGCGTATKEMDFARDLPDREFVGLDLAESALVRARGVIAENGIENLELIAGDFNDLHLDPASFDVVAGFGAVHHIENLEGFWQSCREALRPGGCFVAQEYVGANRYQWSDEQCALGTELLQRKVGDEHKVHHTVVEPVPLDVIVAIDPSEAVRSAEIVSTCREAGFDVTDYHGAGCGLLQPMLMYQMHTFEPGNWVHNRRLAELFAIEAGLIEEGRIGDNYAMFTAHP